ncbi:MAG: division/cell wall cluster transcriptional repressor MraZ [Acidimicrobiales bacterium]
MGDVPTPAHVAGHGDRWIDPGEARCTLFVGQYEHTLDDKGRVVLPPDFREELGQRGYVVRLGERLGLWDEETYSEVSAQWEAHRRSGTLDAVSFRKLTSETQRVKIDNAGRITINKSLLDGFTLGQTVILNGSLSRIEIWPLELYTSMHDTEEANTNVSVALDRMGF